MDWDVKYFQPVYLFERNESGASVIYTIYRDDSEKIRIARVFSGGEINGKKYHLTPYTGLDGTVVKEKDPGTYSYPFSIGQRIRVRYLMNATPEGDINRTAVCEKSQEFCNLADLTLGIMNEEGISFSSNIPLESGKLLPSIGFYKELYKE